MSSRSNDSCIMCNEREGWLYHLEFHNRDGTTKQLDVVICDGCAQSIDAEDWATATRGEDVVSSSATTE